MIARDIAHALGGQKCATGYLCRCPVPSHGKGRGDRTPSLLVTNGDRAALFKCFAGCDARDILAELRVRGLSPALRNAPVSRDTVEPKPDHIANPEALALWRSAGPITADTKAASFLRARGITIEPPPSLRAATILHLDKYPLPALVAAVQAPGRHTSPCRRR